MIEVKQGPYAGDEDKRRFGGISEAQVVYLKDRGINLDNRETHSWYRREA